MGSKFGISNVWLKAIREYKEISQQNMAKRANYAQSVICEVESGKKALTMNLFLQYCNVFEIPPSELMAIIQTRNSDGLPRDKDNR
jgi:transcriptional regulator with XRE-family HTH domain